MNQRINETTPRIDWATAGMVFFFSLPATTGIIGRLAKGGHWFADYEAMACAGQRALTGGPIYDLKLACEGMQATTYVYPPVTANFLAIVERAVGLTGAAGFYGALYWMAAGLMLAATLFGVKASGSLRDRAPYLAMISGSALNWGNVAVVVHGAVAWAALFLSSQIWLLAGVIAFATMIKPVFLTYVAIFVFAQQPQWKRFSAIALTAIIGLAPTLWFVLKDPATAEAWRYVLTHFLVDAHGVSFFGWVSLLGLDIQSPVVIPTYLIFGVALVLAGLMVAEVHDLDNQGRAWLGILVATLLNPRLMSQDLLLIGPGMVTLLAAAAVVKPELKVLLRRVSVGVCVLTLILTVSGGRIGQTLGTLGFSAMLLWVGVLHLSAAKASANSIFQKYSVPLKI